MDSDTCDKDDNTLVDLWKSNCIKLSYDKLDFSGKHAIKLLLIQDEYSSITFRSYQPITHS